MIGQILSTMLPVFLIAGCGALYGRYRTPDIQGLNVLNMELFVPMLVFAVLADQQAPLQEYARLALAATVVVLGSGIVLYPLARVLKLNLKTFLPPMMFNNSGNMGIPLLVLAFGDEALPAAIVLFIVEMLLHFSVGLYMLDPHTSIIKRLKLPIVFASIAGLSALLHTSALLFDIVRYLGVLYLFYMAWSIWHGGAMSVEERKDSASSGRVIRNGIAINLLNPKLTVFFLAFLPQFVPATTVGYTLAMTQLALVFMVMTFVVFVGYGGLAALARDYVITRPKVMKWLQRSFAGAFGLLGLRLALTD